MSSTKAGDNTTADKGSKDNSLKLTVLSSLILPLIVSLVVSMLANQPRITDSSAHKFLDTYYRSIVNPGMRRRAYNDDLTPNFKVFPGHDWHSFVRFWSTQRRVQVILVTPVSGNAAAFSVSLKYYSKKNKVYSENVNFWLSCSGLPDFGARFPGVSCPWHDLKIDITQQAASSTAAAS